MAMTKGNGRTSGDKGDDMLASITLHAASFNSLLSLIPPHLYLSDAHASLLENAHMQDDTAGGKFAKNKKNKDKEKAAAELKARRKEGKRAKLDPANQLTIPEIQASRLAAEADVDPTLTFDADEEEGENDSEQADDAEHAGDTDEDMADSDEEAVSSNFKLNRQSTTSNQPVVTGAQHDQSISEVRQKLQAKIEMLAKKRRGLPAGSAAGDQDGSEDDSISGSRSELLEERRRKRGEMRDRRRRERKAERRATAAAEEESRKKGGTKNKGAAGAVGNIKGANGVALGSSKAPALLVNGTNGSASKSGSGHSSSAQVRSDAALSFSALKFDHPGSSAPHATASSSSGYKNLPSDPKAALATLEARKARDEKRAAKRAERGGGEDGADEAEKERLERIRWAKANAAAEGVKIRDDETLLKKAAKRVDKQKAKSKKEWDDRAKEVADTQAARIRKRNDNLAARKEKSKNGKKGGSKSSSGKGKAGAVGKSHMGGGKGGKGKGKPAGRAGFEGKSKFGGGGGGARKGGGGGGRK